MSLMHPAQSAALSSAPGATTVLRLRWTLARAACRSVLGLQSGLQRSDLMLELALPLTFAGPSPTRACLIDPDTERTIWSRTTAARPTCEFQTNASPETFPLLHVELAGWLSATIRVDNPDFAASGAAKALYARTPLLNELGIAGGRYELASATLEQALPAGSAPP